MKFFKSIFIPITVIWLIFVVAQAILSLTMSINTVLNLAVILSAAPLLLFLSFIMFFKKTARTSVDLLWLTITSFLGCSIVVFLLFRQSQIPQLLASIYALSSFFMTFLYVYWYSNNNRKVSELISNNCQLSEFILQDYTGNEVYSSDFIGKKTLILFFRGNWCPLCMAQINELCNQHQQFNSNNIDVVFISSQSAENTKYLIDKYNQSFKFYIDKDNTVAKQLGLLHKFALPMGFQILGYGSHSVYPTVIAIDETGKIIYNNQTSNYRVRPETQELLSVFL